MTAATAPPAAPDGRAPAPGARAVAAWLLGLVLLLALLRAHTRAEPLDHDLTMYALIGQELLADGRLYVDAWDVKPPALYLSFAAACALLGCGPAAIYLLNLLCGAATTLAIYAAGAAGAGRRAGLLAAAAWVLCSGDLPLQGNQPNCEQFLNAALTAGLAGLLALRLDRPDLGRAALAGAAFALATLFKSNAVFPAAALIATHPLFARGAPARRHALAQAGLMAGIGVGAWVVTALGLVARGLGPAARETLIDYNHYHVGGDVAANLVRGLAAPFPPVSALSLGPLLLWVVAAPLLRGPRPGPWGARLLVYALGTYLAVASPGKFFMHYYQLWLPLLALAAGTALASARLSPATRVAALLLVAGVQGSWYVRYDAFAWSLKKFGPAYIHEPTVGRELDRLLAPGETFYQWGSASGLHFYARRRPPVGIVWSEFLLAGPGAERRTRVTLEALDRRPPELLVYRHDAPPAPADHPVAAWLRARYGPPPAPLEHPVFAFEVLRGGALEARLRATAEERAD